MSPTELAAASVRVLTGDLAEGLRRLAQLADELEATAPAAGTPERPTLALLAVDLHSWYTLLESILEKIISALEGAAPGGPDSHAALLRHAARDVEGVRPAILKTAELRDLHELRRFRHLFRHASAFELRYEPMRPALSAFAGAHASVHADLLCFAEFLTGLIAQLDGR